MLGQSQQTQTSGEKKQRVKISPPDFSKAHSSTSQPPAWRGGLASHKTLSKAPRREHPFGRHTDKETLPQTGANHSAARSAAGSTTSTQETSRAALAVSRQRHFRRPPPKPVTLSGEFWRECVRGWQMSQPDWKLR